MIWIELAIMEEREKIEGESGTYTTPNWSAKQSMKM
jgi:hypothetical protein